jgi:RNA polymerase sigma-70 factor (ECF subfamily)
VEISVLNPGATGRTVKPFDRGSPPSGPLTLLQDGGSVTNRIRLGDAAAFDQFLECYWPPLVWYLNALTKNLQQAQDLAQEAFLRVWEQRAHLRPSVSAKPYLYQTARNLALNELKRVRISEVSLEPSDDEPSTTVTPLEILERKELRAMIERAVDALPLRRREAFLLAHHHGLSHREIAQVMQISVQTVANQISSALSDLRELLTPYLFVPPNTLPESY